MKVPCVQIDAVADAAPLVEVVEVVEVVALLEVSALPDMLPRDVVVELALPKPDGSMLESPTLESNIVEDPRATEVALEEGAGAPDVAIEVIDEILY